jgi:hypothetical protein
MPTGALYLRELCSNIPQKLSADGPEFHKAELLEEQRVAKVVCKECHGEGTLPFPKDVTVSGPIPFLCKNCTGSRSMLDSMTRQEIDVTPVARELDRERAGGYKEYANGKFAWINGGAVRRREKDTRRKFCKRNGFTPEQWHARVDALGWFCTDCRRELTPETAVRWCADGSRGLDKTIPLCRACQCKRVGLLGTPEKSPPLSTV